MFQRLCSCRRQSETQDNDKRRVGRGIKVLGLTLEGQTMLEKLTTKKWQDLLNLRIEHDFEECCACILQSKVLIQKYSIP